MHRYTIVKEVIGEYVYSVEAEDEEAAVALVTSGLIEPDDFDIVTPDGVIVLVEIDD
jgi:hypothetical protein